MVNCLQCEILHVCKYYDSFCEKREYFKKGGIEVNITSCDIFRVNPSKKAPDSAVAFGSGVPFGSSVLIQAPEIQSGTLIKEPANNHFEAETFADFNRRSDVIKSAYKDVNSERVICPSCKSEAEGILRCVDCGRPVCEACGTVIEIAGQGGDGIICSDCWTDVHSEEGPELSPEDKKFIENSIKINIPEK